MRRRRRRPAAPDNIPFWKSDFSAVLAIFGAPSPSLLRSFHPSHSRSYVRSISYPALRSNPSDPTYSKAAAAAMPCSMLPLPVVPSLRRHYSDSIPAGNKLNRPAGSAAGDEANFCRIFRRSDSMSSHVNSMNFYVVSIEYAPLVAWCKENAGNLRPRAKAFHFHEVHSWRASQFDSPCPPRHEDVAFPLSRAELLRMFVEVLVLPDTQSSWLFLLSLKNWMYHYGEMLSVLSSSCGSQWRHSESREKS